MIMPWTRRRWDRERAEEEVADRLNDLWQDVEHRALEVARLQIRESLLAERATYSQAWRAINLTGLDMTIRLDLLP